MIDDLLDHKSFPTSTYPGLCEQVINGSDLHEGMQQSGVPPIDFGGFDQTFAQIGRIRLQDPDEIATGRGLQLSGHGLMF